MDYQITFDGSHIISWNSFHDIFKEKMEFFEEYGRNMNAWIDCMSDIYTCGQYKSLTQFDLNKDDRFIIVIENTETWMKNHQDIFLEFIECLSFVNTRNSDYPDISLVLR